MKIKFYILIPLILMINYCNDPAVYSNSPVDDIKVNIQITKNSGNNSSFFKVNLYNHKDEAIVLENGSIYVNDSLMNEPYWYLFGQKADYYSLLNINIKENKLYTFSFKFNDGNIYNAWIRTPAVEINQLFIPDTIRELQDLLVKWNPVDFQYPQILKLKYLAETNIAKNKTFTIEYPHKGEFLIEKKLIRHTNTSEYSDKECTISIISSTEGVFDENFSEDCTIKSTFIIEKRIEITN